MRPLVSASSPVAVSAKTLLAPLFVAFAVFDVVFLCSIVVSALHNRLAIDDFGYLAKRNEFGVLGGASWFWNHWTGRFAASTVIGGVGGMALPRSGSLAAYTLATFTLVISSLSFLFATSWRRVFKDEPLGNVRALVAGVFGCALLYLGTRNVGEVWFWLAGSATYALPLALLFAGLACLIASKPATPFLLFASLLFGLIPFFNDSLAVIVLPFLFGHLVKTVFFTSDDPLQKKALVGRITSAKAWGPLVCCFVAWLLCSLAPGQKERVAAMGGLHWDGAFRVLFLLTVRGTGFLLIRNGHAFLLSFAVGAAFGNAASHYTGASILSPLSWPVAARQIQKMLAFAFAVTLLTLFPPAVAYGLAVDRVYIYMTVAFVAVSFCGGATLARLATPGRIRYFTPRQISIFAPVAVGVGALLMTRYTLISFQQERAYAHAYDRRHTLLRAIASGEAKPPSTGAVLNLDPLPSSGPLYTAEILHNQKHWINIAVKEAYGLPQEVRLAGEGIDAPR